MRPLPQKSALLIAIVFNLPAQAGTVEQAFIMAEPQMQVKDGEVQGCGYRLTAMPNSYAESSSVLVIDTSFNIYASAGIALLKGGALQVPVKGGTPGKGTNKPIESFWLKATSAKPTAALNGKVIPAETKGYLLYGVTLDSVVSLFGAVIEGSAITIGMRLKGESIDYIYAGVVQLSDQDKEQGAQCVTDLQRQLKAESARESAGR